MVLFSELVLVIILFVVYFVGLELKCLREVCSVLVCLVMGSLLLCRMVRLVCFGLRMLLMMKVSWVEVRWFVCDRLLLLCNVLLFKVMLC